MRVLQTLYLFAFLFLASCLPRFVEVKNTDLAARYFSKISVYNTSISQIKASLDIRGNGLLGVFFHEQADIILRTPKFLFWSLRSFFGPPSSVIATNGEFITIYDFLNPNGENYQKFYLQDQSVFMMFDFAFHPASMINMLMAKIPLDHATQVEFLARENQLQILAALDHGWRLEAKFDLNLNRLIESRLENRESSVSYLIKYADFQEASGIEFPRLHVLTASNEAKTVKIKINFSKIELNGVAVEEDKFFLSAP